MLGPEHPSTLRTKVNLARSLSGQGKDPEAELLERQVLEVQERVLGREHDDLLRTKFNLADSLRSGWRGIPGHRTRARVFRRPCERLSGVAAHLDLPTGRHGRGKEGGERKHLSDAQTQERRCAEAWRWRGRQSGAGHGVWLANRSAWMRDTY